MMTMERLPERQEIEALLPWHAAGTLNRRDAQRVETALASDRDLAKQYAVVRDELAETILLNETLGAPSARAMQKLMASIEAEGDAARRARRSFNLGGWIAERLTQYSPRTLAWSAAAAALAIVLQAGLIAGMFVSDRGGVYDTASVETGTPAKGNGSFALISFAPNATFADINKLMGTYRMSVVDGPRAGGLYKVRVAVTGMPKEELAQAVKRLQGETSVVRFVYPANE